MGGLNVQACYDIGSFDEGVIIGVNTKKYWDYEAILTTYKEKDYNTWVFNHAHLEQVPEENRERIINKLINNGYEQVLKEKLLIK